MVTYDEAMGTPRQGGRAVLTMEPPARVKSVRGWDGYPPTGDDFGSWVRDHAYFTIYVTRLSDLKTAKIAEIADVVPENPDPNRVEERTNYANYTHEGDEPCIVHRCEVLERGTPIFDDDGNMPIVYSSFAPSQMVFKFDLWEQRGDRENPPDGPGPAGEVYMDATEFRDYLRWHARWSD